jgi:hypothetical protein
MSTGGQVENDFTALSTIENAGSPLFVLQRGISSKRCLDFLLSIANSEWGDIAAFDRTLLQFGEFCPQSYCRSMGELFIAVSRDADLAMIYPFTSVHDLADPRSYSAVGLRDLLRKVWREPTPREREGEVLRALMVLTLGLRRATPDPADTQKELNVALALIQALKVADRMRVCTGPECHTPFFLARNRNQKFCSTPCAAPSRRESKREWWAAERARRKKATRKKAKRRKLKS